MSFDFNPIGNLSNVQASHKSCDGGGGNTGYFQRGKKEEDEEIDFSSVKDYPDDSFEKENDIEDEIQSQNFLSIIKNLFLDLFETIKNIFKK